MEDILENLTQKQKIFLAVLALAIICMVGIYMMNKTKEYTAYDPNDIVQKSDAKELEEVVEKIIVVHITGQVKHEGIVQVAEGSRLADVIKKAGGTKDTADLSKVNLAYIVKDGQKIYIPSIEDQEIQEKMTLDGGKGVILEEEEGFPSKVVNINQATQTELETLTGIGPSTAMKIIKYREKNGKFRKIEDIKNVPGIGESKFENIKNDIGV